MELGDFKFLESLIKDKKHKHLFDKAREKKKKGMLIPDSKLFSFFTNVKEKDFKGILYVPFKSEGLSLYLKEQTGKGFDELESEGILVIPRYLTYEQHTDGRAYHEFWGTLMDDIVSFLIKHDPRIHTWSSCTDEIKIEGIKVIEFNPFSFNVIRINDPNELTF